MAEVTLKIKPTSGLAPFEVQASLELTIGEFKEVVSAACTVPADQIRLIYKGRDAGARLCGHIPEAKGNSSNWHF